MLDKFLNVFSKKENESSPTIFAFVPGRMMVMRRTAALSIPFSEWSGGALPAFFRFDPEVALSIGEDWSVKAGGALMALSSGGSAWSANRLARPGPAEGAVERVMVAFDKFEEAMRLHSDGLIGSTTPGSPVAMEGDCLMVKAPLHDHSLDVDPLRGLLFDGSAEPVSVGWNQDSEAFLFRMGDVFLLAKSVNRRLTSKEEEDRKKSAPVAPAAPAPPPPEPVQEAPERSALDAALALVDGLEEGVRKVREDCRTLRGMIKTLGKRGVRDREVVKKLEAVKAQLETLLE